MVKGSWLAAWMRGGRDPLLAALGRLEREVMDVVWRAADQSVRDVQTQLPRPAAYTTVMTTLDRLFKKGLVLRRREGRAFVYAAARSRGEMAETLARGLVEGVLAKGSDRARPFLSNLVDAVGEGDAELLDELERMVRDKQTRNRKLLIR